MRRRAALDRGGDQPDSLMARLAQLETGARPTIRTRPRPVQRFIGLSLLGSGIAGIAVIVALPLITPEQPRDRVMAAPFANAPNPFRAASASPSAERVTRTSTAAAPAAPTREVPKRTTTTAQPPPATPSATRTAAAAAAPVVPAREAPPARVPAVEPPGPPPPLNMTLTRTLRGTSPFPLQVSGVTDPDNARVIVRDLPATVRLTSGERRDQHTWSLRLTELGDLQANLGDGTPEIFDIAIEIASTSGAQILKTSARVRLAPRKLPSSIEDLLRESKAKPVAPPDPAAVEKPFHTEVTSVSPAEAPPTPAGTPVTQAADAGAAPLAPEAERKPLPDGLNALGGPVARADGDAQAESPADSRKLWWKLPAPSPTPAWAPFGNSAAR